MNQTLFGSGIQIVSFIATKWSKHDLKLNGHLSIGPFCLVFYGDNKIVAKNGPVLGWLVTVAINHLKTRLVWFSDVYCSFLKPRLYFMQKSFV
jgi:hypothetical protein